MMTETLKIDEHVGAMLSGFVDGELTQQEHQRVRLHCENCEECNGHLRELRSMREKIGRSQLSDLGKDVWRETMDDKAVKTSRGIGWLLLLGGVLLGAGAGVYEIVTSPSTLTLVEKLIVGGVYGGILLIFVSVLRQRLIERKTDKYEDVEI
jgi:putative zinc finger protein